MTIRVTCHPIDRKLMEYLGIYVNSEVIPEKLGMVLEALADVGYTKIHAYVRKYGNGEQMCFHCKKDMS